MNELISHFIQQQTCANICTLNENGTPYCFTCFFAFNSKEQLLLFKSSTDTTHSINILRNPLVAGTILPDKLNKLQIKGVQFEGEVLPFDHPMAKQAPADYYLKNPMAVAVPGEVWTVKLQKLKYTDNTLGFGKKLHWVRDAANNQ
ncbi:MAG TPA: pyridoxamine 5'-phosphate oxidase family protein [Sediminibacterium sp.]|nr:pyridoxamine 5'-phosphate oxidase family protein [Sediminibacterium sp.]